MSMLKKIAKYLHRNKLVLARYFSSVQQEPSPKYSYISMPSDEPLLGITMGNSFDINTQKYSQRTAVQFRHQNISKTFLELKEDVDKLARSWIASGLQKGDRIGIWSTNCYEWLVVQFASMKTGAILVCINPALQSDELTYCLNKTGVSTLVAGESFRNIDFYRMLCSTIPSLKDSEAGKLKDNKFPLLKNVVMVSKNKYNGILKYDDLFELGVIGHQEKLDAREKTIQNYDPAIIYFTSGTTGNPKAAIFTHHNLVNVIYYVGKRLEFSNIENSICLPLPLFHAFAGIVGSMLAHACGVRTVYPSAVYDVTEIFNTLHEEKTSILYGAPTIFYDVINSKNFENYDLTNLKKGYMGGTNCTLELFRAIEKKIPSMTLAVGYGMTEATGVIALQYVGASLEDRQNNCGLPLEHTEICIVDNDGQVVPRGTSGEIWFRGFTAMLQYWDEQAKTEETMTKSRWIKTGDLGVMDDNGHVQVVGRKKDLIIRKGENINPVEIEQHLETHKNVLRAQVIGIPDERVGEEACACIVARPGEKLTEKDIRDHCENKIATYKIPRYIIFFDQFVFTSTGKIRKNDLLVEALAKLKKSDVLNK